jgi:Tfp pilus assembly protein PilO
MADAVPERATRYHRYYRVIEPILKTPKNRAYTAAVFSFLAISLFGWYAIRPTIQTILFLRQEIADKSIVNQKMEEKINALIEAQAAYENVRPQLTLILEAMPPDPEALNVVTQLRNLAVNSGLTFTNLTLSQVPLLGSDAPATGSARTARKSEGVFTLSLVLNAPFTTVKSFIDGVVSMRRILSIDSVNIVPSQELGSDVGGKALRLVLKLTGYYTAGAQFTTL